ncbi:hypothetical protein CYMTET_33622 [Cymbomonas tetramitiformis]|uniref:Uncharacterized protein n=1 Tax=Cymbomonas tetramitiformis TaxID=36881 RepID=A0AAE0FDB8_9CHLO|nr:hypothetical protein CYMTET_33622 [Cymbomonas tetramitiformis]
MVHAAPRVRPRRRRPDLAPFNHRGFRIDVGRPGSGSKALSHVLEGLDALLGIGGILHTALSPRALCGGCALVPGRGGPSRRSVRRSEGSEARPQVIRNVLKGVSVHHAKQQTYEFVAPTDFQFIRGYPEFASQVVAAQDLRWETIREKWDESPMARTRFLPVLPGVVPSTFFICL